MIKIEPWALFALMAASFVVGGSLIHILGILRYRRRYGRPRF